ncbi:hypothetical protein [Streptomyces sp. 2231.1]|uniref:hypothetical protein n=1 Tax=Streptomyces sp. 2231.1 TaxID=1855347 RepID=UPI000A551824|nr:hypothetical protein [Streptomyces sp. 2231.1]
MSSRFQFVDDHRGAFGVKRLCRMAVASTAPGRATASASRAQIRSVPRLAQWATWAPLALRVLLGERGCVGARDDDTLFVELASSASAGILG